MSLENKAKICIIVEGKSDLFFIRDLILVNFQNLKLIKNFNDKGKTQKESVIFESKDKIVDIVVCKEDENIKSTGGWANIARLIPSIIEEEYAQFIVVFDSDNEGTDKIEKKMLKIDEVMNMFELKHVSYFLPFNEVNKGNDLEDLILSCIQPKYKDFFACWENFSDCLNSNFNDESNLPNKKKQLYTFKDVFNINNDNYTNKDFWNLNSNENKELEPLVQFLEKNLK